MKNTNFSLENLSKEKSIITTKELMENGYSHYFIKKMQQEGYLSKIKRGIYIINSTIESQYSEIQAIVPKGILCLLSAAYIHELTTFIPKNYQFAISNKSKIVLPNYPPIKLYYWNKKRLEIGIIESEIEGVKIKIYDKEKTVCDIIRYRNKIGLDIVKEILKNYINYPSKNLTRLNQYAKELGNTKLITTYISILL